MKLQTIALLCALVGETLLGITTESETKASGQVLARLGESKSAEGARQLYVYSKEPLIAVRYNVDDQDKWAWMKTIGKMDEYFVYSTGNAHDVEEGTTFQVAAVNQRLIESTDRLIVKEDEAVEATRVGETKLPEPPPLEPGTLYHGSPVIHPQVLAQARANEMARRQTMVHFGGGIVRTLFGRLAEGIGCGGRNCHTCVATNGTAAVGDGQAVASSGQTYRCRLYNSPGTTNGGGGGRGRRR